MCAITTLLLRAAWLARGLLPPNQTCPLSGTTNKCHPQGVLFFPALYQPLIPLQSTLSASSFRTQQLLH